MKHTLFCKLRLLLPLMAAVMLSFQRSTAQTRIAVVSDIHVMAPSLLDDPENTEWQAYYKGQRKMLQESADLFDQFVDQMKTSKPDILLITGDLTKDGEIASHNYVRDALAELSGSPYNIKVYVIPGNHDLGITTVYKYEATNQKTALSAEEKMADATAFKTFYENYGYGAGSTIDPNGSISYVAEPVSGLVILGIDSHNASVGEATLNWLCSQASAATDAGKQVIAMMHHPLFPHITGANLFIDTYTVANYETVRNKLIDAGVKYIFTGHFHTSDIAYDWNDDETNGIYDINTGSLISYPCDYRMLDLSADKKTLSLTTLSLNPSGSKEWLKERVKTITTDKMNAKAGNLALSFSTQINNLASFAADLFILHAEGTENESEGRKDLVSTYTGYKTNLKYNMILSYGGINDATIYSILDDKSNYGSDHENQTDDRWMDILSINDNGWGTYCTGRDLDVSLTSGLTAYQVTGVNSGKATLTAITEVPASAGFLVNGEAGTYELKASYVPVEGLPENLLTGTISPTAAPANSYVMATKNSKTGFYPAGSTLTIPAHKAYLTYNGGSSVRMISLDDEDATGIDTMESVTSDNESFYTLQGTKAGSLRSGLYIKNGKLIIIK